MVIREEKTADRAAIFQVTAAAFRDHPVSRQTEPFIIDALRAADALAVSLVAERDGRIVGHIAFSPVTITDGSPDWYGLGPISVLPELQGQSIGTALVTAGLTALIARGGAGCVLVGEPSYYQRFGFRPIPGLVHDGVPNKYFLALPFSGATVRGRVEFHHGFAATG